MISSYHKQTRVATGIGGEMAEFQAEDFSEKEKIYVLAEFPYPSGSGLHIGHAFSYTGGDVYARFQRMQGATVHFVGADDAHGAAIMIAAEKAGLTPQEFVAPIPPAIVNWPPA